MITIKSFTRLRTLSSICLLALSTTVNAGSYIYTPGQGMKVISQSSSGYVISDLAGGGNTIVQQMSGGDTMIMRPDGPTTFIHNGDSGALVTPIVPLGNGLDLPIEPAE